MTSNSELVPQPQKSPAASLTEHSTLKLQAAIRSEHNPAAALRRINAMMAMPGWFRDSNDPETEMAIREEFVRALDGQPDWALQRAFDKWVRNGTRRPSTGEINILIGRELKPITDEIARRQRIADQQAEDDRTAREARVSPEVSAVIMAKGGFTPKRMEAVRKAPMAGSFAEADAAIDAPPVRHWTETASAGDLAQLAAARAGNRLMQEGMAQAERMSRMGTGEAIA